MKKVLLSFALALIACSAAVAQDKVEGTVCADVVSSYIWRGQKLDAAAIQPTLGIAWKGISLSVWGSYGFTAKDALSEIDLTLAYTIGGFNVGITDYWNNGMPEKRYFKYGSGEATTAHTFEANIGYDFGFASLQWFTNFAGYDGRTESDKRAYTSYVEATVPFKFVTCDWEASVGAIPYSANSGYYTEVNSSGFAVTNVSLKATKDLKITDSFKLPLFAQVIGNPSAQSAYFVFGFTLDPFQ